MPERTATQPRPEPRVRFTEVRRFDSIDSTNRYLIDAARAGAAEGLVVVADHQDAGRGRLGRRWEAPPGASLLTSVLLRPPLPPRRAHVVSFAAALAAADAVAAVAGIPVDLKWPNDLMASGRKLAGILAEADVDAGRLAAVVVGLGINVQWDSIPSELDGIATACNLEAGRPVDRDAVLARYLHGLEDRYEAVLGKAGPDTVVAEYRERCATLGARVRVEQASSAFVGNALDVDDDGRLIVERDHGGPVVVAAGDVVHLRPAPD